MKQQNGMSYTWMTVLVLCLSLLVGCGSTPKTEVVTLIEYKHPSIPETLFGPVQVERPMSYDQYMQLTLPERETYMREYSQKVLKALKASNLNTQGIKKILEDTKRAADNESKSRN